MIEDLDVTEVKIRCPGKVETRDGIIGFMSAGVFWKKNPFYCKYLI